MFTTEIQISFVTLYLTIFTLYYIPPAFLLVTPHTSDCVCEFLFVGLSYLFIVAFSFTFNLGRTLRKNALKLLYLNVIIEKPFHQNAYESNTDFKRMPMSTT